MQFNFPPGFVWGSATAALQIEGATDRGDSVWDIFCRQHPERIHGQATPEVACDHYHRWAEDVDWMARLGHTGYRMSLSWPRIDPLGNGRFNPTGLDFYDRLLDALLSRGIAPNVTLYHWDLPASLVSWEAEDVVDRYLAYAEQCFTRYGDRVKLWSTLNEPAWTTLNGYVTGLHPPARHDYRAAVQVAHNLLTAHAQAVRLFHSLGRDGQIGIALNLSAVRPATDSAEDQAAATLADGLLNRWFIEPVLLGRYPQDIWRFYEQHSLLPRGSDFGPDRVDWIGVNYYYPHYAAGQATETRFHLNTSGRPDDDCLFSIKNQFRFVRNPHGRYTEWQWEIDPGGLSDLLRRADQYVKQIPIYVTENGIGLADESLDDAARIRFVQEHLEAVHDGLSDGINIRGYYMWSLLDNFSWINGYQKRYGFLSVDRASMQRTPRHSAFWFRNVARDHGFDRI